MLSLLSGVKHYERDHVKWYETILNNEEYKTLVGILYSMEITIVMHIPNVINARSKVVAIVVMIMRYEVVEQKRGEHQVVQME